MLYHQDISQIRHLALKKFKKNEFFGSDHIKINYYSHTKTKNKSLMIISPGRAEYFFKYLHFLFPLINDLKIDLYYFDHRGQGESERFSNSAYGYVDQYQNYSLDFQKFYKLIEQQKCYKIKMLFSHSMGSLIALIAQLDPSIHFDLSYYSSPLLKIHSTFSHKIDRFFVKIFNKSSLRNERVPFSNSFDESDFNGNLLISDFDKYLLLKKFEKKCEKYTARSPSSHWVNEMMKACEYLMTKRSSFQNHQGTIFQAGNELMVDNLEQEIFFSHFKEANFMTYKNEKHELLWDGQEVVESILQKIKKDFENLEKDSKNFDHLDHLDHQHNNKKSRISI